MKIVKTNAMRQLDKNKIKYDVYTYDASDGFIDGQSVAKKCNQDPVILYKTLVTRGHSKKIYVFVINVLNEMDLKKCAKAVGEKSIEMIHVNELFSLTGYIRGGCSPIGMKKNYPIVVSDTIENINSIVVSGGKIGYQIHLSKEDFLQATHAICASVIFD